jgi:hypothetical protein
VRSKSSRPSIVFFPKTASFLGEFDVYQAGERQRFLCTLMQFIELGNGPWRRLFVHLIAEKPRVRICARLWSPGIDSEESIPLVYVSWWAGTTSRIVVPARQAGNRFLGTLQGVQIRALAKCCLGGCLQEPRCTDVGTTVNRPQDLCVFTSVL